jgi:hypothetical protein
MWKLDDGHDSHVSCRLDLRLAACPSLDEAGGSDLSDAATNTTSPAVVTSSDTTVAVSLCPQ